LYCRHWLHLCPCGTQKPRALALSATAWSLRQRAATLGVDVFAPNPESWTAAMERKHPKDTASRNLALALLQQRGAPSVLGEIQRLIQLDLDAQRRALR
jgi:hypothetical protein